MFDNVEASGNPWRFPLAPRAPTGRRAWGYPETLAEKPERPNISSGSGCAGSYDERNVKVSIAAGVRLLERAGVSFAMLRQQEMCNGETARRMGNEYLYQTMAKMNVEAWNAGVRRPITQCPHCFNTIKNEYPEFGGEYRVINHTQLIERLDGEERLKLSG